MPKSSGKSGVDVIEMGAQGQGKFPGSDQEFRFELDAFAVSMRLMRSLFLTSSSKF